MTSYWMYGLHACTAALKNSNRKIDKILLDKRFDLNQLPKLPAKVMVERVDAKVINLKSGQDAVHQGVAMLVHPLPNNSIAILENLPKSTVIVLDQLTDPHNVGAIWRSAAAFGVDAIILTDRNSVSETGVLAKSASGALEIVPAIVVINLVQALESLKSIGFWIYGFTEHTQEMLGSTTFAKKTALVLGSEGSGMRPLTARHCDVTIKIASSSLFTTLNVSNAAAVAMYEVFKQQ